MRALLFAISFLSVTATLSVVRPALAQQQPDDTARAERAIFDLHLRLVGQAAEDSAEARFAAIRHALAPEILVGERPGERASQPAREALHSLERALALSEVLPDGDTLPVCAGLTCRLASALRQTDVVFAPAADGRLEVIAVLRAGRIGSAR